MDRYIEFTDQTRYYKDINFSLSHTHTENNEIILYSNENEQISFITPWMDLTN